MVEFDSDMFHVGVADVVLGKSTSGVVVAQKRRSSGGRKTEAGEEFTKESIAQPCRRSCRLSNSPCCKVALVLVC